MTEVATIIFAAFVWAIRGVASAVIKVSVPTIGFTSVWRAVSVVASATIVKSAIVTATAVIRSAALDVTTAEFAGAWSRGDVGAAMIDGSPKVAISASGLHVMVLL